MDYKVVYSARTGHDLAAIVAFRADKNPAAARRLGHDLLDAADALSLMPYRGPAMRGRPQLRREGFADAAHKVGAELDRVSDRCGRWRSP